MRRAVRRPVLALALVAALAAPAAAQVAPGDRVRVTILARVPADSVAAFGVKPGARLDATYLGVYPGTIALFPSATLPDTIALPRPLVAQFETVSGSHGHAGSGALIGLAAGTVLGIAFGQWFANSEGSTDEAESAISFGFGAAGALGGLGLGALIGSAVRSPTWRPVPLPADPPREPAPTR